MSSRSGLAGRTHYEIKSFHTYLIHCVSSVITSPGNAICRDEEDSRRRLEGRSLSSRNEVSLTSSSSYSSSCTCSSSGSGRRIARPIVAIAVTTEASKTKKLRGIGERFGQTSVPARAHLPLQIKCLNVSDRCYRSLKSSTVPF